MGKHRRLRDIQRQYSQEMILSKHQPVGPHELVLVLDGLKPSYNLGKIIRTGNAFGVRELHLVNILPFDPAPAMGALKQTKTKVFERIEPCIEELLAEGYTLFAFDPAASESLAKCVLPRKSAFVFGHEEFGLSFENHPSVKLVSIPQFGKVQSLNVAVTAGIAAFEWLRQNRSVP